MPPSERQPTATTLLRCCWKAQDVCATTEPQLVLRAVEPHPSACHFAELKQHVVA